MVDESIDNTFFLEPEQAIKLIKEFFTTQLPDFEFVDLINKGSYLGFFLEYRGNDVVIKIGGSQGGLNYELYKGAKRYSLDSTEERMKTVYTCSQKNLAIVFLALKKFLGR